MKYNFSPRSAEVLRTISNDRLRTNLFKKIEQKALVYLVQRIPSVIHSDMLTFIGFMGSAIIFASFILATYINKNYLLLGIFGLAVNWFGDSLDGRIAIYRNKSRKWYGFTLDLTTDWLSTILIGWGYVIYADGISEMIGFGFVVLYGWAIITTLSKYKITGEYTIDFGSLGPTEVRVLISAILLMEVLIKGSIIYSSAVACTILFFVNFLGTIKLLQQADEKDLTEKGKKLNVKIYESENHLPN